ncbi:MULTISPECIES: hypothetical protein [Sinorhizobium]|uniref:hypothetical protein n=1 Tax=Sinorhizobium TaxID=28105 RepID=UPI0011437178|nr:MULTISPECIES: hypothetical protein [Sinorhizobium]
MASAASWTSQFRISISGLTGAFRANSFYLAGYQFAPTEQTAKTAKDIDRDQHRPAQRQPTKVLCYMTDHSDCTTPDVIQNAGEHTMRRAELGALIGLDFRGVREWVVTDEGRAEIMRKDKWRNWRS